MCFAVMVGLPLILLLKGQRAFYHKGTNLYFTHQSWKNWKQMQTLIFFFKKFSYRLTLSQNFSCDAVLYHGAYKSDTHSVSSAYH